MSGPPAGVIGAAGEVQDLIVMKAFAGRSQDWPDIEGIVLRRGHRLDSHLIERELEPLLALKEPQGRRARTAGGASEQDPVDQALASFRSPGTADSQ
jgi:hypothetical protein